MMDTREIRELSIDEIDAEIEKAREELFRLRYRASYEQLENPALLRQLRRQVSRLMTIRHESEPQAAGETDG